MKSPNSGPTPPSPEGSDWRTAVLSTALCLAAGVLARAVEALDGVPAIATALYLAAYGTGGWEAAWRSFRALRQRTLDVDFLMLVAALGAAAVEAVFEGAVLLFLFSLGNALEKYAFHRTRRSIHGLMALRPETASRVGPDGEQTVAVDALEPGDLVRIRPGERIAVDGRVLAGRSHVDESTLTGEAAPVGKKEKDEVFAGTLNCDGALDVHVTRHAHESTLSRVIRLVESARESRAPTQSWLERVQSRYAAAVLAAAALAVIVPVTLLDWTFSAAFYRAMTLLVVASPCALVISIPATIVSAVANGARNGVLFKGGAALDALADVRVFALDKTGTVTRGTPRLTAILPLAAPRPALSLAAAGLGSQHALEPSTEADDPERELLRWAAAAELKSEHHLAKAVVASARERGLDVTEPPAFQSYPGRGVRAFLEGREILVGKPEWIEEETDTEIPAHARRWAVQQQRLAATLVFVAADGQCAGVLALCDQPRPGVRATLAELRRSGVERTVMLTGDDAATARVVADQVGISEVVSSLLPEEKAAGIAKLRERFGPVAMVGDGVNDAPALATADVGVALGAAGTDVALDTADVVIMGDDLNSLVVARRLAVRARRIVRQNLVIASGVLLTLVTLALLGRIGLTLGVLGHEGSTIVVVLNGLRLLGNRG